MFNDDNDLEEPASMNVQTASGVTIDVNNLPGKKKIELIMQGELQTDDFVSPGNMPGKKLAELRARHNAATEESIKNATMAMENKFKVGNVVEFRGYTTEIVEIDEKRGVKIRKREGGISKWIHHSKVKLVDLEKDE